jgi:mannosyltransferase
MFQEIKKALNLWMNGHAKSPALPRVRGGLFQLTLEQKLLAVLVVIGSSLRLYSLAQKSIWLDEAFSITISQHGLFDLPWLVSLTDTHPPLYYLALKLWLIFGNGETQVRMLSAIFSIAAIPLIYLLAANIFDDKRIGLIAATLLAFSPFQIWYAQEARMYAMLIFFVLASACFFFRALRYNDIVDWIGYIFTTVLALYTDNGAIWYIVAISIFFLLSIRRYKDRFLRWFLCQLAIVIVYLPWLPVFVQQTRRVAVDFWLQPPSFQTVLGTLLDFNSYNFPIVELSLLYMVMIFVWAYIIPRKSLPIGLASLWLFIPLIISLLFSLRQPIFISRNLIAASLGYYLLVAGTIGQFRNSKAVIALLLPLVVMNLISIGYNFWYEKKEDWRSVARYEASETENKSDGLMVFVPGYAELPFHYYFKDYGIPVKTQGYPGDEVLLHPTPKEVGDLPALFEGVPYVWLIMRSTESVDPDWTVKEWLDKNGYVRQKDLVDDNLIVLTYYRWDKAPETGGPNPSGSTSKFFLPLILRNQEYQKYGVKAGETLLEIALRFNTTVQALMDANHLQNMNDITDGQELLIPKVNTNDNVPVNGYP